MTNHEVDIAQGFVVAFTDLYVIVILLYIVMLWVRLPYSLWTRRVQDFCAETVMPWLQVFRRFIPMMGALDLSPMIATFAIFAIQQVLVDILGGFRP